MYEWCLLGGVDEYNNENPAEEVKEEATNYQETPRSPVALDGADLLARAKREEERRYNRTLRSLPISERIQATKDNRIMNRWADMNKTWDELDRIAGTGMHTTAHKLSLYTTP
mgnify:CR=1 FL=1